MPVLGCVSSTLLAVCVRIDDTEVTMNTTGLFLCILLLLPACFADTDVESDLSEKMAEKLDEVASLNAADVIQDIREQLGYSGSGSGSGSGSDDTFMDGVYDDDDTMM
ncbi:uncharacterized protein LOC124284312 [Haliotis rubra]|uniref:uncharacterized protein LOC124284312 n=1 Tax=Haliotis rubra TaxID=36100 RepID=UPI001EE58ABB|nr:uncharacterized protein LOC124284312 [Haliotis rubra]